MRLSITSFSGLVRRAVNTAAVAAINVRMTKKCHGLNVDAAEAFEAFERFATCETLSVEVAELIGETFFQL
jgi:lipoate-protein ligase B